MDIKVKRILQSLALPACLFLFWTLVGVLGKFLFLGVNKELMDGFSAGDVWDVVCHGLRLDLAVGAYLTLLPLLLCIVGVWSKGVKGALKIVLAFESFLLSMAIVANIALYPYWGFPLDTTSLFYLATSPADAMASITAFQMIMGVAGVSVLTWGVYKLAIKGVEHLLLTFHQKSLTPLTPSTSLTPKILSTFVLLLLGGIFIIPIRGGFGVATNNTGSVYFSQNMRLNHAAVNPVFSFMESVSFQTDYDSKFRFMEADEADRIWKEMMATHQDNSSFQPSDSLSVPILREGVDRPNIVFIILESFSRCIMDDGGQVTGVTPCLDSLCREGVYFTNFYANSFRTDRGLVSILSGFPAQPDMSLMKVSHKTTHLYSIANSLRREGYSTHYYYGGNANFTNMRSYLLNTGFESIVSEDDFPVEQRSGKWGVHDEFVFDNFLHNLKPKTSQPKASPSFTVIQTSSSHEPFEVPYTSGFDDAALNAFAYTDHCVGQFIDEMRKLPEWDNTLIVLVPDHLGCYPANIDNYQLWRYQIPLIMVGGAVSESHRIDSVGMQVDLAATLLAMLGIDHSEFTYSKNMLDSQAPHFAFFCCPNVMGMVDEENSIIYDYTSDRIVIDEGASQGKNLLRAKAFLQKMYDDIERLN